MQIHGCKAKHIYGLFHYLISFVLYSSISKYYGTMMCRLFHTQGFLILRFFLRTCKDWQ